MNQINQWITSNCRFAHEGMEFLKDDFVKFYRDKFESDEFVHFTSKSRAEEIIRVVELLK